MAILKQRFDTLLYIDNLELYGYACPECGDFCIEIQGAETHYDWIVLGPDGVEKEQGGNTDWPDDAKAECRECGFKGTIENFSGPTDS